MRLGPVCHYLSARQAIRQAQRVKARPAVPMQPEPGLALNV